MSKTIDHLIANSIKQMCKLLQGYSEKRFIVLSQLHKISAEKYKTFNGDLNSCIGVLDEGDLNFIDYVKGEIRMDLKQEKMVLISQM